MLHISSGNASNCPDNSSPMMNHPRIIIRINKKEVWKSLVRASTLAQPTEEKKEGGSSSYYEQSAVMSYP